MKRTFILLAFLIFEVFAQAGEIRMTFLQDAASLKDTVGVLTYGGCGQSNVTSFQEVVHHYYEAPFDFDFGKFPKATNGFYSFASTRDLVAALPHHLSQTKHPFDFNCMDMVVLLAGDHLQTRWKPDDIVGPLMVIVPSTNGSEMGIFATPRDAFTYGYDASYLEASKSFIPTAMQDARICLTPALYSLYVLPRSNTIDNVPSKALEVMRTTWRRETIQFPTQFEVVLVHATADEFMIATEHTGLLFPYGSGYVYIEKSCGMGPFVRIDLKTKSDLQPWLSGAFVNQKDLGHSRFATFNADSVMNLNAK